VTITSTPPGLDPDRLDAAFSLVARQVADGRTTYAGLAVRRSSGVVRSDAVHRDGHLDPAPRTAIASITKPIAATAVLQLVEAGQLVLNEPISTWIPRFRPAPPAGDGAPSEPITPWHVLTHTAGLTDAPDDFFLTAPPNRAAMVERLLTAPLRFRPGTAYAYTSDSFYLLSELIERISGIPYPDFVRDRILRPLGMAATTFVPTDPGPAALPLEGAFGPAGAPRDEMFAYFVSLAMPGGGLWSTPDDVATFGRAMLNGGRLEPQGARLLGRPFVDLMTRHHTTGLVELGTTQPPAYGLGWGRPGLGRGTPSSRSAFSHGGASGSMLIVDPTNDLVVVYLRNDWGVSSLLTNEAIQAVYGALD
jgi:CubicO group peptidase (beta-lactamase class C family)